MTKQDLKELLEAVNNIENVTAFCREVAKKTGRPVETIRAVVNNFKKTGKIKKVENYEMLRKELFNNK